VFLDIRNTTARDGRRGHGGRAVKKTAGKRVGFQVTVEPGSEVFLAGSFNNWNPRQYRMRDNPGSGHSKTTLVLPPGRYEYKFVVNGDWRADPNCAESMPNDQGSQNSVITV
jgi:1,4-alpha-glucan branching enzyme